jgi:hypothetical protein
MLTTHAAVVLERNRDGAAILTPTVPNGNISSSRHSQLSRKSQITSLSCYHTALMEARSMIKSSKS